MEPELRTVAANGLEFACLELGSGPLALCLHGFPDSAHTWSALMPELAGAGFRAVAPFQRGYAPTAVPEDGEYRTGMLARDANALHEALGGDGDAVIVGHDWGATATYGAACLEPARWRRVIASAVPPATSGRNLMTYDQLKRSFYILLFQLPMAEQVLAAGDMAFLDGLWRDWTAPGDYEEHVREAKAALRDQANREAALGYYRALLNPDVPEHLAEAQQATMGFPSQPTLYIHGSEDAAIGTELLDGKEERLSEGSRVEVIHGANHFSHLDRPEEVNRLIVDFAAGWGGNSDPLPAP